MFWDRTKRCLYVLPIPMCGVVIDFRKHVTGPAKETVIGRIRQNRKANP